MLGCYFHLCQSVIRRVNEIGLKTEYESNDEVCSYTSAVFQRFPPDDVQEAFELFVSKIFLSVTKALAAAQVLYLVRRALDIGLCGALLAVAM